MAPMEPAGASRAAGRDQPSPALTEIDTGARPSAIAASSRPSGREIASPARAFSAIVRGAAVRAAVTGRLVFVPAGSADGIVNRRSRGSR